MQRTLSAYGRIDVLINNAGVGLYGLPTEVAPALFSRLLEVNVVAPLALAQLVIPVMLKQGSGTIVTMGSVAARVALPWAVAYSASKSALLAVHDSLRLELRGTPIRLLKVYAGIVDTDFRKHVLAGQAPARVRKLRYVIAPATLAAAIFRAIQKRRRTLVPALDRLALRTTRCSDTFTHGSLSGTDAAAVPIANRSAQAETTPKEVDEDGSG